MEIMSVGVLDSGVYWTQECTGLRSFTDVVLKGFSSRLTYTRMCYVWDKIVKDPLKYMP